MNFLTLVIKEHEDKRNGVYSPDAKDVSTLPRHNIKHTDAMPLQRFAFGKSKTLTEFESQVYLRMLIKKLSEGLNGSKQPLIFLFHNAAAEKNYFQLMNLDVLDNAPERIPAALLRPTPADFRNEKWSGNVILDTQRLWKAFLIGDPKEKEAPLALGKICRELGVATKYLHNAGECRQVKLFAIDDTIAQSLPTGNDALYTLKVFTKLAELESEKRKRQREAMQSGGATV